MSAYCCACGRRVPEGEKYYKLNKSYPNDFLCASCVTHLQGMSHAAKAGNPQYLSARRAFIRILNSGVVSDSVADYFDGYMDHLNRSYEAASPSGFSTGAAAPPPVPAAAPKPIPAPAPTPAPVQECLICPQCGAENLADSAFCERCAAQLKPTKYCRFCGGQISPLTDYCETCGRDSQGNTAAKGFSTEKLKKKAESIGGSLKSTGDSLKRAASPASGGARAGGRGLYAYLAAGTALILALLIFGKMFKVTMPVLSLFSSGSTSYSFSLLKISQVAGRLEDVAYMLDAGDSAAAFKTVSAVVMILGVLMLLFYAWVILAAFLPKQNVFKWLGAAGKAMCVLLLALIVFTLILNAAIQEEMGALEDVLLTVKPTALLYIALILNAVTGFWLAKFFGKRSGLLPADRLRGVVCPHCGSAMDGPQNFCLYCGKPIPRA